MARSTVIASKPLLVDAIPETVLFLAGTMFAGLLAVSDAYGFHGDEMYADVARQALRIGSHGSRLSPHAGGDLRQR